MKEIIDVQIGEVVSGRGAKILKSSALGSCVAVIAYDAASKIGAMAHVMLPGTAPANKGTDEKTKYVVDAIGAMIADMTRLGSTTDNIEVVLVGAANVLQRPDDTICRDNIESIRTVLKDRHLRIAAEALGGTSRRCVSLDIEFGIVSYSEGDDRENELWRAKKINSN